MNATDMQEFCAYLKQCTDRQVQGVYDREREAGCDCYAQLAIAEADRRRLVLDLE